MKKNKLLLFSVLACCFMNNGTSYAEVNESPTATKKVYDFTNFVDTKLLDLFDKAIQDGRKYPTEAEFEAAGILKSDIAFIRSHVRKGTILDRSDRLISDTYEKRDLWMNIPMSIGKDYPGNPSNRFADDVFSMWNYTNLFGSWNHGFFTAAGAWVDAAHKNGTNIMSGIKFFESWGTNSSAWNTVLSKKNGDGSFKYVKPIINCLMYFGSDGINYNWEDAGYSQDYVVAFNKALHKEAKEQGFDNFQLGLYTSLQGLTTSNVNELFGNQDGRTAHTMLNYNSSDFSYQMASSVQVAENSMGTSEGLYAGVWIASMNRRWNSLNTGDAKKCGLCLWGEHSSSRFWSYNSGSDAYIAQDNYQSLLERAFSGGNRNPLTRPAISNTGNNWEAETGKLPLQSFAGLASWIPERSAIQGNLPFATNFNLGNGDRYTYKGKKTAGSWYNMANQDIVPTYRWLVTEKESQTVSTAIQPQFSHNDSYNGGSCLLLTGTKSATTTDVVLFKTKLTVNTADAFAKVAIKSGKEGENASNLFVILRKSNGSWIEFPVGSTTSKSWEEKNINLTSLAQGDVIDRIGLRVKSSDANYKLYVGKLEINDKVQTTPADVKDLVVEVKEETKTSLSVKLNWEVNQQAQDRLDWGLLYNDEANIDHFEVLYKNGENGKVSEISRTTQWADYVGDILFESENDAPYIGVRAVSTDLKTYSPIEWVAVTRADQSELPEKKDNGNYGVSEMDPGCDGADVARVQRYVTDFTTKGGIENITYHANGPQADGTQYVDATDQVLKVSQGQQVTLYIKAFNAANSGNDGLKWCFAGGWMDLDGSQTFNPDPIDENPTSGERLFRLGTLRASTPEFETAGITHTFTIPSDACPGKSRLRIVFSDAWFEGSFLPSGYHSKGFSMDFGVEIIGDNTPRQAPVDTHDQGEADEPEDMRVPTNIHETTNDVSSFFVSNDVLHFNNVEKAWIYNLNGTLVNYLVNPTSISLADMNKGAYLVRMKKGAVIRSGKFIK